MPVYKETRKEKLPKDGRCYYFKCCYIDQYGNAKRKQHGFFKTKKECEQAERNFLNEVQYRDVPNYDISFMEAFKEWWNYKKQLLKDTTAYMKIQNMEKHLIPYFKDYKLHSIKATTLLEWKEVYLRNQNISVGYQNQFITHMKEFLEYSVQNFDFDPKVVGKLQKNKIEVGTKAKDSEWNFWTYEEFKQFIEVVDDEYYKLIFTFLYFTGVRIGELCGLTWVDVDLNKKTLRINKSFSNKVEKGKSHIFDPKTKNSFRVIDLDDNLVSMLKKYYEQEKKIYRFNTSMYLFGNTKHLAQTTLRRKLEIYKNKTDLKKITIHGFRHSHASLLFHLGLDSLDIAERLGDTKQMVETTYYHMYPEKKSNTVSALNQLNL